MEISILPLLVTFVPIIASLFLPLIGKFCEKTRNFIALASVLVSLGISVSMIPGVLGGHIYTANFDFASSFFVFRADMLAVFMAVTSSLVGAVIVLYSFEYIAHYENRNEYYFMVVLFLGSMVGLVFSNNLILLYVFWEITAIACWRLIGFFRKKEYIFRADKAFLVTVFGAVMMLLGFIAVYNEAGSFDLTIIQTSMQTAPLSNLAAALILLGIFSKSSTLPLHTWLPDAGVAPSPVTALLHAAVLVKIGVYVFARLFVVSFNVDIAWHTIIPWIAGASALVSAGAAMVEYDMKRIIAYSTISQIGFIFLGLSINNEMGIAGGLLYILMHGIAKGGLFLCAGIVEQTTHTKDIRQLGGLIKTMPVTAISFLLCAFSVMGIPSFGGFFSKFMVISGAASSGQLLVTASFIVGAFMTIIYLFRIFSMIFLGELKKTEKESSKLMMTSVALLAFFALVSGIFINYPSQMAEVAAKQMLEMKK